MGLLNVAWVWGADCVRLVIRNDLDLSKNVMWESASCSNGIRGNTSASFIKVWIVPYTHTWCRCRCTPTALTSWTMNNCFFEKVKNYAVKAYLIKEYIKGPTHTWLFKVGWTKKMLSKITSNYLNGSSQYFSST